MLAVALDPHRVQRGHSEGLAARRLMRFGVSGSQSLDHRNQVGDPRLCGGGEAGVRHLAPVILVVPEKVSQ